MVRHTSARAVLALAFTFAIGVATAHAASVTFNFGGSSSDGSIGNQRVFTDAGSGISVYVTAFFHDSSDFDPAAVGRYSGGLGACNPDEDGTSFPCSDPEHAVDNLNQKDFLLFLFSAPVDINSVSVNEYGGGNTDVSYWLGTVGGPASQTNLLSNLSYSDLAGLGFGSRQDNNGDGGRSVSLNSPLATYNALLFGATVLSNSEGTQSNCGWTWQGWKCSGANDYFKVSGLTVDYTTTREVPDTPVPEPASVALLGLGLAGVATVARRR